jgi:hypothetical protein
MGTNGRGAEDQVINEKIKNIYLVYFFYTTFRIFKKPF